MLPHQERVLQEKLELDEKISKLSDFICTNNNFLYIEKDEQNRLIKQLGIMKQYSNILLDRIEAF